jgi:hypothetical protein
VVHTTPRPLYAHRIRRMGGPQSQDGWVVLVRLAAAEGDPTVSTQAVQFGPMVRRGLWLPPIVSREQSAGAPQQGAPATNPIEYRCTSTGSAHRWVVYFYTQMRKFLFLNLNLEMLATI